VKTFPVNIMGPVLTDSKSIHVPALKVTTGKIVRLTFPNVNLILAKIMEDALKNHTVKIMEMESWRLVLSLL